MIDVIADLIEVWTYFFFVCKCSFLVVLHVVGYFSCFGHFANQYFDGSDPVGNLTDQFFAVGTQHFVFFSREYFFQSAKIFEQSVLIGNGSRYDVVNGEVAQYTAFDLHLHGIFLQFHFQTAVQFGFVEDTFANQH